MSRFQRTTSDTEYLTRGYEGRLFLWITLGWALAGFGRKLLPPLLPEIINDLSITSFEAGLALTTLWLVRALNQFPGGRLTDELGRKSVLFGSLLVLVFGFFLLSTTTFYFLFVVALAVIGFGDGAFSVSLRTTVADLYVQRRGQAFGLQGAFTGFSGVAAAGGAILVLAVANWRTAFLPLALALLVIAIGVHVWQRGQYNVAKPKLELGSTAFRLLENVTVRRVIGSYVLFMFAWQGTIGFLPVFLHDEKGLSATLASVAFGLVYLVGVVAAPLAGILGDRIGKLRTGVGVLLCSLIGLSAVLIVEFGLLLWISIILLAVGFRSFFDLTQAFLMDAFADETMGGDLGAAKTTWSGLGSLGPAYVGWVAGWSSYTVAYTGLVFCVALSLGLILLIRFFD